MSAGDRGGGRDEEREAGDVEEGSVACQSERVGVYKREAGAGGTQDEDEEACSPAFDDCLAPEVGVGEGVQR